MIGQHHQFHHYNPGKSEFGEERYFKITKRIYEELDERLSNSKFLAGENIQLQILQLGLGLQDMNGMILVLKIIKI
jgi:glutathione S-transferase